jgi:uncharacterized HAD superfamily protein
MNIGIDIDGVLTDFSSFRLNRGEELLGQIVNENAYKFKDMFGCYAYKELIFWLHNLDYLKLPVKEGSKELIDSMKENNDYITFITKRFYLLAKLTRNWLSDNDIYYDQIFHTMFKLHIINKYNIDLMIEDSPTNITYISEYIPVIAIKAPYNEHIKKNNVFMANDLFEAKDIYNDIRKKRLLKK